MTLKNLIHNKTIIRHERVLHEFRGLWGTTEQWADSSAQSRAQPVNLQHMANYGNIIHLFRSNWVSFLNYHSFSLNVLKAIEWNGESSFTLIGLVPLGNRCTKILCTIGNSVTWLPLQLMWLNGLEDLKQFQSLIGYIHYMQV